MPIDSSISGSAKLSSSSGSVSSSSGSSSPSCPEISWVFNESGMLASGGWTENSDKNVRFNTETSQVGCSGTNDNVQTGSATGSVTVPIGKKMTFDYTVTFITEVEGDTENPSDTFDVGEFLVNTVSQESHGSSQTGGGCASETEIRNGSLELAAGLNQLELTFDTIDERYHTDQHGIQLVITNCQLVDV